MAANAVSVGGDFTNSGTYTITSGQTTTFTATGTGFAIDDGTATFQNVTFNGASGGWSFASAVTLSGDLTVSNGTLSGTNDIDINGNDMTGNGTVTMTGGTVKLPGTASGGIGGNTGWTFYNLTLDKTTFVDTTTTASGSGGMTITNVLTTGSATNVGNDTIYYHTLDAAAKTWILSGSGSAFANSGKLNGNTSTFRYTGTSATTLGGADNVSTNFYYHLELKPSSGSPMYTLPVTGAGGQIYVNGNMIIGDGTNSVTVSGTANNSNLTVAGNFSCTTGAGTNTLQTGNRTWAIGGDVTLTNCDTFTATSGHTLTMTGSSKTFTHNTSAGNPYNVTISGSIAQAAGDFTVTNNLTISGSYTSTSGTLNVGNAFTNDGSFSHSNGSVAFNGASGTIAGSSNTNFYDLHIVNSGTGTTTLTSSSPEVAHTLEIGTTDTLSLGSGLVLTFYGSTFTFPDGTTISGAGMLTINTTTVLPTTGTLSSIVRFDATAGNTTVMPARTYGGKVEVYSQSLSAGRVVAMGAGTHTLLGNLEIIANVIPQTLTLSGAANDPTVNISGDLTETEMGGDTTSKIISGAGTWTVGGNVDVSCLSPGNCYEAETNNTLVMTGTSKVFTTGGTSLTLYNFTADGTITASSGLTISHDMVINGGFTASAGTINIGNNWTNAGTFTHGSGTITFNATDTGNSISGNTQSQPFNNVVFSGSGGEWTNTTEMQVSGTLSLTNGTFTHGANVDLRVFGNFTLANGTVFTAASGTGLMIMDGNPSPMTFTDNTSPRQDMGNVQIGLSPGTTNLGSDMTAKSLTVAGGDTLNTHGYDLDIGTGGISIAGTLNATDVQGGGDEGDETTMDTDGKFDLQSGGTFTPDISTLTMTIAATVVANVTNDLITLGSGDPYDLVINDGGGTYTLTVEVEDPLTVSNNITITGGTLDAKSGEDNAISVGNNWTNNDSFNARSGTVTFTATDTGNTIGGTLGDLDDFYNLVFNGSGGGWSNSAAIIVGNDLTVTLGTLSGTNNITMYGTLSGGGTITFTGGTFLQKVAAAENFGSTSNANDWTFNNLSFETSGATDRTVTFATGGSGQVIVSGTLTVGNAGDTNVTTIDNETNDRIINANGAVTITSKGLISASSTASFTVAGNWTNNGDFTDNSGTVTLDGGSQQTLSGQMTGASDRFNNLVITNVSGTDPVSSPSVIFAAAADTAGTFTAATANTKLRFSASATYTFQNISFNGQATGTRVFLRSSTPGTQWNINVAGTRTVSNTDVKDSDACGQAPDIDASDGTNEDSGNNDCWLIKTLTFSISDTSVGFGALNTALARFATGDLAGADYPPAVAGHTISIATNAPSGYAITYYTAQTLTSASDSITAATIAGDEDGVPGSKQFGIGFSTNGNATITSAYAKASNNYSYAIGSPISIVSETVPTATEIISAYYVANISSTTQAGAYSTDIMYVVTATF
jgi:hypothetical protein